MARHPVPLVADDISAFSRALAEQLQSREEPPGHLSLMNMLARAAGFQNYQHLRAAHAAGRRLADPDRSEPVDHRLVERALNRFDQAGRLQRWPSRRAVQDICVWALWTRLPIGVTMHEREVNDILRAAHLFGDPAVLRRRLVTLGLVSRNRDGSDYRRLEKRPPPEARRLIAHLKERRQAAAAT